MEREGDGMERERNDKKEQERNDLAEGPCSRTERNDSKKFGKCPALVTPGHPRVPSRNFSLFKYSYLQIYMSEDLFYKI